LTDYDSAGAAGSLKKPATPERKGELMAELKIVQLEPQRVAYFRSAKGYEPEGVEGAFGRLDAHFSKNPPDEKTLVMGLSWDDPQTVPPEKSRYDAAFTIPGEPPAGVDGVHELPGGTFAEYRHVGPYDELGRAFGEAHRQLRGLGGYRMRKGACREVYRNDPAKTPPAELVTDIYLPVEQV
jgi:AraC family transcriptional regulator